MSKAPEIAQIRPEDYPPESQEVVSKLADQLNNFFLQVSQLLTRSLTFADNFNAEIHNQVISEGSPLTFKLRATKPPLGVVLLKYVNSANSAEVLPGTVGVPQWSYDGVGNVTIESVPGLTSGQKYDIILLVIMG